MKLNSAGKLFLCMLAASSGSTEPIYVEAPGPADQFTGHLAILQMIVPQDQHQEFSPLQDTLDLREQVYREVMAGDVGEISTADDTSKLDQHASAVFKSVAIPAPDKILAPAEEANLKQRNNHPVDPFDITSAEFMLKNLVKGVATEIKKLTPQDAEHEKLKQSAETQAVLAVTHDELFDQDRSPRLNKPYNLVASDDIAPLESSFLYVLLCKIGLASPSKNSLDGECG